MYAGCELVNCPYRPEAGPGWQGAVSRAPCAYCHKHRTWHRVYTARGAVLEWPQRRCSQSPLRGFESHPPLCETLDFPGSLIGDCEHHQRSLEGIRFLRAEFRPAEDFFGGPVLC